MLPSLHQVTQIRWCCIGLCALKARHINFVKNEQSNRQPVQFLKDSVVFCGIPGNTPGIRGLTNYRLYC